MLQWLKRSLASLLGDKKDLVKNLPIIKNLNKKAISIWIQREAICSKKTLKIF